MLFKNVNTITRCSDKMVFTFRRRLNFTFVLKTFLLIQLVLVTIELLTLNLFDAPKCFMVANSPNVPNYEQLEDVLLAKEQPSPGNSIFFIDSRCKQFKQSIVNMILPQDVNVANLYARHACAVESAALHNPSYTVFVFFATTSYLEIKASSRKSVMDALMSYPNVRLRNVNVQTFMNNTPAHEWFLKGDIFNSSHIVEHMSDLLRLIALWRWGGLYLDLDAITLRSMEHLPPNYIGMDRKFAVLENGVMNFSPTGIGHNIVSVFLQEYISTFNAHLWIANGPLLVTRTISNLCRTNDTKLMINNPKRCNGIHVLHPNAFYAIDWNHWIDFFIASMLEETMKIIETSYITHIWNHLSTSQSIEKNSALDVIAKEHCPRVYSVSESLD